MKWLLGAFAWLCCLPSAQADESTRWAVYYSDALPASAFSEYDMLVFDADHHPSLDPLREQRKILLGYISLGEIEAYRTHYDWAKKAGLLLEENPNWEGHYILDVRNPVWAQYVIESIIPSLLEKGFDGIMIDTIDSPIYLEAEKDAELYKGMQDASARLIHVIRMHYPSIPIMLNRGFVLLPEIAGDLTYLMAESTYTSYDFSKKEPYLLSKEQRDEYQAYLQSALKYNPELTILTLDYWDMQDKNTVQNIYTAQRAEGFSPYVTTIDLHTHTPEPK